PGSPTMRPLLAEHLARTGDGGDIRPAPPGLAIRRPVPPDLRASIIVPFRDRADLLARCVASIRACATHPAWELLLVDNCSTESATEELLASLAASDPDRIRVLRHRERFNFSAINNVAAREARGDVLVLLNNDTEILTPGWLEILLGLANRPQVGAVGVLLLYPDDRI